MLFQTQILIRVTMTLGGLAVLAPEPGIIIFLLLCPLGLVNILLCILHNIPIFKNITDLFSPIQSQGSWSHRFPGLLTYKEAAALAIQGSEASAGQKQGPDYWHYQVHPGNRASKNKEVVKEEQKTVENGRKMEVDPIIRKLMYDLILKKFGVKQVTKQDVEPRGRWPTTALTSWGRIARAAARRKDIAFALEERGRRKRALA